jgi:hypothetical protein
MWVSIIIFGQNLLFYLVFMLIFEYKKGCAFHSTAGFGRSKVMSSESLACLVRDKVYFDANDDRNDDDSSFSRINKAPDYESSGSNKVYFDLSSSALLAGFAFDAYNEPVSDRISH